MSADADRIAETLRFALCVHDVQLSRCSECALVRIAQLTAELASRDRIAQHDTDTHHRIVADRAQLTADLEAERAAHERTKAELAEVRKQRDGHEFELGRIHAMYREVVSDMRGVIRERDAAITRATDAELLLSVSREACESVQHQLEEMRVLVDERGARLEAAQAEAAEMRAELERIRTVIESTCTTGDERTRAWLAQLSKVLAGEGGRALAARVPLWRELEHFIRFGDVEECHHDVKQDDCDGCDVDFILEQLAALDEKGADPK